MKEIPSYIDSFSLFELNGWKLNYDKTSQDNDKSFFYSMDISIEYITTVTAEFIKDYEGLSICDSFGVLALSATYEYKEDLLLEDLENIIAALDHAETNLLNNGIPFVKNYEFYGKTKKQKALKNQRIRKRMHIDEIEANARKIREKEEGEVNEGIQANDTW